MSGHARSVPLLVGDGACAQFALQCHHALIGEPSPTHANQPWYPTVIFPTTSPTGLAAAAGVAVMSSVADTAASAEPAATEVRNVRRVIAMRTPLERVHRAAVSTREGRRSGTPAMGRRPARTGAAAGPRTDNANAARAPGTAEAPAAGLPAVDPRGNTGDQPSASC